MSQRAAVKSKHRAAVGKPATERVGTGKGVLWLCCAALAVLLAAAYANSLSNGFVWDDHQQIVLNENLRAESPLARIFTADVRFDSHSQSLQGVDYRPLQMLTYRLVLGSFGTSANAFHAVSLGLTIACAIAAFFLALRLLGTWQRAFAAAALFALYPVHTEATDWIAALPELGCTLFVLLAMLAYLRSRAVGSKRAWWSVASALSFFIALLWKETAIVFPLLLIAAEWLLPSSRARDDEGGSGTSEQGATVRRIALAVAPSVLAAVVYLGVRWVVLGGLEAGRRDWQLNPLTFALNDLWLLAEYAGKLIVPFPLNAYVLLHPIRSIGDARALGGLAFFVAAIAVVVWLLRLRSATQETAKAESAKNTSATSLLLFGAAWTLISLLPAMNLSALGRNALAERYLFLPSFGFCVLLVRLASMVVDRLPQSTRRYAAGGALAVVLVAFFAATVARNPEWKDDATLFGATLAQSPEAPFVRVMVATAQSHDATHASEAEENFRVALANAKAEVPQDRPDAVTASRGLAWSYANHGQIQQALDLLDAAAAMDPTDADTDGERGLILLRAGQPAMAAPLLERAAEAEPNNENVLSALGLLARDGSHDPARAVALFQRALAAHAGEDDFAASQHNNLAAAYADLGNWEAAIAQEREAVRILPSDPEFHVNLAGALASSGHVAEARMEAQTALQLSPNDPAAMSLLRELTERFGATAP